MLVGKQVALEVLEVFVGELEELEALVGGALVGGEPCRGIGRFVNQRRWLINGRCWLVDQRHWLMNGRRHWEEASVGEPELLFGEKEVLVVKTRRALVSENERREGWLAVELQWKGGQDVAGRIEISRGFGCTACMLVPASCDVDLHCTLLRGFEQSECCPQKW